MVCLGAVSLTEYTFLQELYTSTHGGNWTWRPVEFGGIWNFSNIEEDSNFLYRPCVEAWQGLACYVATQGCYIAGIKLVDYNLDGTIPNSLGDMTGLTALGLQINPGLRGRIPTEIGLLSPITEISLARNGLTGRVPSELGQLHLLTFLSVEINRLTGTLPSELFTPSLTYFYFSNNLFSGSLPSEIGHASNILYLELDTNHFHEQIPSSLFLLRSLINLGLAENIFSGTLPWEVGNCPNNTEIALQSNFLTGSLPPSIAQVSRLSVLSLNTNQFTGVLPEAIGYMSNLTNIDLNTNSLSGSIPSTFSALSAIYEITLFSNRFTGPLPPFTGCHQLRGIDVHDNLLTGPLPSTLLDHKLLDVLFFTDNYLTGTLGSEILGIPSLTKLSIGENLLWGTLPAMISNLLFLRLFDVHNNHFTGDLNEAFPPQRESSDILGGNQSYGKLTYLDLSDNGFSGSFPSSLFSLPTLAVLSATSNCFSGALNCEWSSVDRPYSSSNTSYLSIVDLSGLSSGSTCRNVISAMIPNSGYYPTSYMEGSIPDCVWKLPNLTVLSMVGNGFDGSVFPDMTAMSQQLTNVSLAYNEFTGWIPTALIDCSHLESLDLSFNRISGTLPSLDSLLNGRITLNLANNRLSGPLPTSAANFTTTKMTDANNDSPSSTYVLFSGSVLLDISLIISSPSLLILLFVLIAMLLVRMGFISVQSYSSLSLYRWMTVLQNVPLSPSFIARTMVLRDLCAATVLTVVAGLVIVTIFYAVLKTEPYLLSQYSTHSWQYSWIISAAYTHGVLPVVLIVSLLLLLLFSIAVLARWAHSEMAESKRVDSVLISKSVDSSGSKSSVSSSSPWGWCYVVAYFTALFVVNFSVVVAANSIYLVEVLRNNPLLTLIQMVLAVFKLLWGSAFISLSLLATKQQNLSENQQVLFRFVLQHFNFIIAPCLSTSLVEGSCFLELFQQQPAPVDSIQFCPVSERFYITKNEYQCMTTASVLEDVAFDPPFMYSFQCGSALIANYVPVLLYVYVFSGILFPMLGVIFYSLDKRFKFGLFLSSLISPNSPPLSLTSVHSTSANAALFQRVSRLFNGDAIMARMLLHMSVVLTFGLAYPYLGLVILVCGALEIVSHVAAVGRFVSLVSEASSGPDSRILSRSGMLLEASFRGIWEASIGSMWSVIVAACVFWALITFDMIADVNGAGAGFISLPVIALVTPVVVYFGSWGLFNALSDNRNPCCCCRRRAPDVLHPSITSFRASQQFSDEFTATSYSPFNEESSQF